MKWIRSEYFCEKCLMRLLLLFLCIFSGFFSIAQNSHTPPGPTSIVKDSTGRQYSYQEWQELMQKDYLLRDVHPDQPNHEYLLVKMTEKQYAEKKARQKQRMENVPPRESNFFKKGEQITLFNTSDMHGKKVNMKEMKGKVVVLNFWFINCPPCRAEIPELNKLVDSFKTNDKVVFIAVALDDKQSLETFLEQSPFQFTIIDNGRFITSRYSINMYPTHLILDTEGKVYFHTSGLSGSTVYWLKKSIDELLGTGTGN